MILDDRNQDGNGKRPLQVQLIRGPMDGAVIDPPERYPGNWGRWLINVRGELGRMLYESSAGDRGRAFFVPGSFVALAASVCPEWNQVGWWEQRDDDGEGL